MTIDQNAQWIVAHWIGGLGWRIEWPRRFAERMQNRAAGYAPHPSRVV